MFVLQDDTYITPSKRPRLDNDLGDGKCVHVLHVQAAFLAIRIFLSRYNFFYVHYVVRFTNCYVYCS